MPKVFIHYPAGTFSADAMDALAEDITSLAPEFERLPRTPYVLSNIWIYAKEYPAERVYHGGKPGGTKIVTVEVNAIEGGLEPEAKRQLIAAITASVKKHAGIPASDRPPVFVLIRDVPAENWGMFGKQVTLDGLRNPPQDAIPV